jgi:hypothetical protein
MDRASAAVSNIAQMTKQRALDALFDVRIGPFPGPHTVEEIREVLAVAAQPFHFGQELVAQIIGFLEFDFLFWNS